VGYFSQVQNWNRSKVEELRDRHKGTYSIPEPVAAQPKKPGQDRPKVLPIVERTEQPKRELVAV
jgi:hypothetical protein